MWPNSQETADLATFTEGTLDRKLHLLKKPLIEKFILSAMIVFIIAVYTLSQVSPKKSELNFFQTHLCKAFSKNTQMKGSMRITTTYFLLLARKLLDLSR